MAYRVRQATVVRRKDYLIPAGFQKCAQPKCKRYARFPTEDPAVGYCLTHDKRVQALFAHARKSGRPTRGTQLAHIITAATRRYHPTDVLDISHTRKMRSLCGLEVDEIVALQSQWLSFDEGRYWLNAIVGASPAGAKGPRNAHAVVRTDKRAPLACLSCVNAYSAILREEHLALPGRLFVVRIVAVENENVVYLHPEGPGVGMYVSRDLTFSLDLSAACVFAKLEDAVATAGLFEGKYSDTARASAVVRRLVEDPDEDCTDLDPIQDRLAWYGGAFRHSDGKQWHSKLKSTFGIEFRLPHLDKDGEP